MHTYKLSQRKKSICGVIPVIMATFFATQCPTCFNALTTMRTFFEDKFVEKFKRIFYSVYHGKH